MELADKPRYSQGILLTVEYPSWKYNKRGYKG